VRIRLKKLKKVRSKRGKGVYYYAWVGGPRIATDAAPGTPEFMQAYNEAIAKAKPPDTGKFSDLITLYKKSTEFTTRGAKTQKDYLRYIKLIETKFGTMPISALGAPAVRGVFKEWKDELATSGLRHADYAWTVLQRILAVAKDRGKIATNPCEKGGRLYEADRSDRLWTDDHVKQFLKKAPKHLHLPLMLALWTGQRQGDLLALPWSAYDGQFIRLRQRKGKRGKGRRVKIPVGAPLKAMLDRTQRVATVILTTSNNTAWTEDGFRASWGKACTKADIPDDLTFHDIRGSAVTRLAEAGCEVPEIATITGHSLKDVEAILDAHYLGWTTKLAVSAVAKLERAAAATGTDGEQKLENKVENGQTVPDAAGDK
jgi:integrase